MKKQYITIIGGGKMGCCLIRGLLADQYPAELLCIASPHVEKLHPLKQESGVSVTSDNRQAVEKADIVLLAVKPAVVPIVIEELKDLFQKKRVLIISVAAGVRVDYFTRALGEEQPIVRGMPNVGVSVRAGMTGLYASPAVSDQARNWAEAILRSLGITLWLEREALLDVVTALSGSGPAYFFRVMESLQHAAKALGLSDTQARLLVVQTALGSARLAIETQSPLSELRQQVTSKKGTTAAAIEVLEQYDIDRVFAEAIEAAHRRAQVLSEFKS